MTAIGSNDRQATTVLRHVCCAIPFHYCSNCMTFLEFLLRTSLPIASQSRLVGSGQELTFKIQVRPLNDAIKTADTVCSTDPFSVDMTQNTLSRPRRNRLQRQCPLHHLRQKHLGRKVEAKPCNLNREISMACSRQFKQLFFNVVLRVLQVFCNFWKRVFSQMPTNAVKLQNIFIQFSHEYLGN